MKLLTFRTESGVSLGLKLNEGIVDVAATAKAANMAAPATMSAVLGGGEEALAQLKRVADAATQFVPEDDLLFAPPVPDAGKIICVGLNYRQHAAESNAPVPEYPIYFGKYANSLAASGETITLPENAQCDYEVELVVVIGRTARNVSPADALTYVFGYATGNDLSARALQFRSGQWMYGKFIDGFSPLGPYVVTADEVPDPQALVLKTWLNGELRQNSSTSDMVFSVAEIIADLSQVMTLQPGDLIYTGTPEGVIHGMARKNWLKPGDEVVCEVGGLGVLVNKMA